MKAAKSRPFGFTLIELLVVIAVIAILAGILFPIFATARRTAYSATCASNLSQFGKAFQLYANDWDGRLPLPGGPVDHAWITSESVGQSKMRGGLWPYIKTRLKSGAKNNFWSCPLAAPVPKEYETAYYSPGLNYVMNDYIRSAHPGEGNWGRFTSGYFIGLNISQCPMPSKVILLFEAVQNRFGFVKRLGSPYYVETDKVHKQFYPLDPYIPQNYHGGKSNFLFLDGHVKLMAPDETWTKVCRDGIRDNITNFTGYAVRPQVKKAYPNYGTNDYWNPRVPNVLYP